MRLPGRSGEKVEAREDVVLRPCTAVQALALRVTTAAKPSRVSRNWALDYNEIEERRLR